MQGQFLLLLGLGLINRFKVEKKLQVNTCMSSTALGSPVFAPPSAKESGIMDPGCN